MAQKSMFNQAWQLFLPSHGSSLALPNWYSSSGQTHTGVHTHTQTPTQRDIDRQTPDTHIHTLTQLSLPPPKAQQVQGPDRQQWW